jgi:hypothetical protein
MRGSIYTILVLILGAARGLSAQTTQPVENDRLEFRAAQAFDRGDFGKALPLLRQLVDALKDRPAKLPVIQERIKACEKALAAQPSAPGQPGPRKPHPAPQPGRMLEMTIKELGNFDYDQDKGGNLPEDVKRLSGSKIRLTGFMIPIDQAEHISQFALVPSLFSCCFGQPPQVQHTVVCTCPKGKSVSYCPDQVVVEGTLTVAEKREDGFVTSIFQVEPTSITVAPKDARR